VSLQPFLADATQQLVRFLEERGVEYALLGGLAVRVHGLPRTTYDVDALVGVGEDGVAALARAADERGFVIGEEFRRGFVDRLAGLGKIQMSVRSGERYVPVDVFVLGSDYQRAAFARRVRVETDIGALWVISPEDVLLHKLLAYRTKDRADIDDLLLVAGRLDREYLSQWAVRLGFTDRLREVLQSAGRLDELP
jgi:hypothetical protein